MIAWHKICKSKCKGDHKMKNTEDVNAVFLLNRAKKILLN